MDPAEEILIRGIPGIPEIRPGDNLAAIVCRALEQAQIRLGDQDILVIAHKIISKAEGRLVKLKEVTPSAKAVRLARKVHKDPRKVEVILRESRKVLRAEWYEGRPEGVLICEHRLGFKSANAGVDESNVGGEETVALLPEDPDASARKLRDEIRRNCGASAGIIITDTFGRPWRIGLVNVAIGLAGVPASLDLRGKPDAFGKILRVSQLAFADEIAAAAGLAMGKTAHIPVVLFRGLKWKESTASARALLRPQKEDLFA